MKTCNFEFPLPQYLDDHKNNMGHTFMAIIKNGSPKLCDFHPHIPNIKGF